MVAAGNLAVTVDRDAARGAAPVSPSLRRGYWFVPEFIGGRPIDIVSREPQGPHLTGGTAPICSERHIGYDDSRTYRREL